MKLPVVVAAATVAVLAVVSGTQAKIPLDGVDLCGTSGCVHLSSEQARQIWMTNHEVGRPLRTPSAFYALHYHWPSQPEQNAYYVPAGPAVRLASEGGTEAPWMWLDKATASSLDAAAAGLAPYAVSPPTTVLVGDKRARGPETYLRLLVGRAGGLITPATIWITVTMRSDPPTPWTDGLSDVRISAPGRSRVVMVDGWVHRVPFWVANRARRGLPLSH